MSPIDISAVYAAMQAGEPFLAASDAISADAAESMRRRIPTGEIGVFSSGSTGNPRCITRTWQSWRASFDAADAILDVRPGDVIALPGPMHSTLVLFAALHALHRGATPVAGPLPDERSTGSQAFDAVHAVPTVISALLDEVAAGTRSAPRTVVSAGAATRDDMWARAEALGIRMVEYYGAAELSFVAWRDAPGPFRPAPGVEIRIDPAGRIWSRSPYVCEGYLDDHNGPLLRDGDWASVGDRGRLDAASGLVVLGRGDTAVTTGGHTVLVEDVEMALTGIDGVREAAVLGVPHEDLGEVLVAVIVRDVDSGHLDARQLREEARELPAPSRPRAWHIVDDLPRTSNGKVDRSRLRQIVQAAPGRMSA